jgi:hypothetical protein
MVRHPDSRPPEYRSGNEQREADCSDDAGRCDDWPGEQSELSWFSSTKRRSSGEVTTRDGAAGDDGCGGDEDDDVVGEGGESV